MAKKKLNKENISNVSGGWYVHIYTDDALATDGEGGRIPVLMDVFDDDGNKLTPDGAWYGEAKRIIKAKGLSYENYNEKKSSIKEGMRREHFPRFFNVGDIDQDPGEIFHCRL